MIDCKLCAFSCICKFRFKSDLNAYERCNHFLPCCISCEHCAVHAEEITGLKSYFCTRSARVEQVSPVHFCAYGRPKGKEEMQEESGAKPEIQDKEQESKRENVKTPEPKTASRKHVDVYTDGACKGNPGPGGWGAIVVFGDNEKEMSGGEPSTTNNRMELAAVIEALKILKEPCDVTLTTDSRYVVDTINKGWINNWKNNGWRKAGNKPVLNANLWEQLLALLEKHTVTFVWVKGHNQHAYNERCDRLASAAVSNFGH